MAKRKKITIDAESQNFGQAQAFVEEVLSDNSINDTIASETTLLFEALFNSVVSQVDDEDAKIEMKSSRKLGRTDLSMCFAGSRFEPPDASDPFDPDAKVIEAFSDKLSYSYSSGYNEIKISVKISSKAFLLPNFISVVLAFIVGLVLTAAFDEGTLATFAKDWLEPLQKLFINAVMMIGAPMTLFSLLKNTTDSFIVSGRRSSSRRLFLTSLITSIVAILLAVILGFALARTLLTLSGTTEVMEVGISELTFASAVDQIIPSNILEPFQTISPIPMIVIALLVTYALFSIGPSFNAIKGAIDACYDLFSRILNIIMALFPFACFAFFLNLLLTSELIEVIVLLIVVVVVFLCTLVLLATYAIRLKAHGYKVLEFRRKLRPLIKENLKIGSVIDAIPFNLRYLAKNFGFSRERLAKELPVMAQTNLDGNCFIIMLLAVFDIFLTNSPVAWLNIFVIGIIVLFLSFGAPNQPGSILIGMMIIFTYLDAESAIPMAMCFELFCGWLQNILNVISGVVCVAESEAKAAKEGK